MATDEAGESSNSTKKTTETNVNSSKTRTNSSMKKQEKKAKVDELEESKTNENSTTKEEEQQEVEAGGESLYDRLDYLLFRWEQERMKALSNKELCRQYDQQIIRSGGFDLGDGRFGCTGLIYEGFVDMDYALEKWPHYNDKVCRYSKLAINQYNRDNNTNYQYVEFVKGVHRLVNGYIYYLTFEAKEPSDDAPTTVQAAVHGLAMPRNPDGTENVLVLLVRKKSCATMLDNRVLLGCQS